MNDHNQSPAADNRREEQTRTENGPARVLCDKLDRLLAKAKPSKRELIQQCFRDLYPRLEAHLTNGVPMKEVLAAFNQLAHAKVCARTFNDMLRQERACRDQNGEAIRCSTCDRPLLLTPDAAPHGSGSAPHLTPEEQ